MDSKEEFLDPMEAQRRAIAAMFAAAAEPLEQAASQPSTQSEDVAMEVIAVEASIAVDTQAAAAVAAPHESTTEAEESSETDGEGASRPISRRALSGMALLLQQMRCNSNPRPLTDDAAGKPNPSELPGGEAMDAQMTAAPAPQKTKILVEYARLTESENIVDGRLQIAPTQTIRECFNCGTAPNFGFSKRVEENNYVRSCKWSPNGKWLATESEDRIARVSIASQVSLGDLVYDTQWHPSLELFATTAKFHPIKLWRPDGECELTFRGINHLDELTAAYSLGFSLDGSRLYAGYYKTIRIFDVNRPGRQTNEIRTFEKGGMGQKAILSCFAMCPTFDGVYAVGSFAGNVGLYSDRTDSCDCLFPTRTEGVTQMQYSADGNYLYVGYRKDTVIQCFDLRFPGQVLHTFERPATTNQRIHFQLDPYDRYLFTGSSTGEVLIHDLKEVRPSADLKEPIVEATWRVKVSDAAVSGLSLHPELPLLATTTGQRVFPAPTIDASDPDSEQSDADELVSDAYKSFKRPLDNSLSLWKL